LLWDWSDITRRSINFGPVPWGGKFREAAMIGYVTLGTNDLARGAKFYDALLALLGAKRFMENDRLIAWTAASDRPGIGLSLPFDGKPASIGNGMMVALVVDSRALVDKLYQTAIALGGSDEGAPGERGQGFYAGYFRDLDGNKLNAFCIG